MSERTVAPTPRHDGDAWQPRRVVVGVDGTAANWPAVQWAATEARRVGCPLVLVGAGTEDTPAAAPRTGDFTAAPEREHREHLTEQMLEQVQARLGAAHPVELAVGHGEPSQALVSAVDTEDLLVVGKRSGHPLARTVLGSTSIAVAGRCSSRAVVVPDGWSGTDHQGGPVVVGADGDRDAAVLAAAFARAQDLDVPLVVVSSWELPAPHTRSVDDVDRLRSRAHERLDTVLAPYRERFLAVEVRTQVHYLDPAVALSGAVVGSQLLVMGRHTGPHHPGGLRLGSTTRRVLRHATCPLLVVPPVPTAPAAAR